MNSDQHVSLPNQSEAPVSTNDNDDQDNALQSISIEKSCENLAKRPKFCSK